MSVKIKICGIREAATAIHAAACGADYVGLVFAEASPRFVDDAVATEIAAKLRESDSRCRVVGLFVDSSPARITEVTGLCDLDVVQVHGHESRADIAAIRDALPPSVHVWKALPFEFEAIEALRREASMDALLLDAPHRVGELTGGTGRTLDWNALAALDRADLPPIMLAGGLSAENVVEAIRITRPWGVDVSSGVEASRGIKDLQKITDFCAAVRGA